MNDPPPRGSAHPTTTDAASSLRPLQIWVPDTRLPGFAEECRRQSQLVALADMADADMLDVLDAALVDLADEAEA